MPTVTDTPPSRATPRRRRFARLAIAAVISAVALGGAGVWWFLRDDAPDEVSLATAAAVVTDDTLTQATVEEASEPEPAQQPPVDGIGGEWTIDTSIGEFSYEDSTGTFVGFRIDEELSSIGKTTAVGRTPAVAGSITIDGTTLVGASIEADMTAITTNESRRDGRVQSALETDGFPVATFELTAPVELGDGAAAGEAVSVETAGTLTIHGVSTDVTIPLEAQLVEDVVVVVGSLEIAFADYGVAVPQAPIVLSVADVGTIELQLLMTRS